MTSGQALSPRVTWQIQTTILSHHTVYGDENWTSYKTTFVQLLLSMVVFNLLYEDFYDENLVVKLTSLKLTVC